VIAQKPKIVAVDHGVRQERSEEIARRGEDGTK
jgi:hypothetical protein